MLSLLPATLVVLLFSPVFSQQVSRNDPFKVIALHAPKPDHRLCYLKVSTPPEPADDEVLLSFEDWKKKQLEVHNELPKDSDIAGNQSSLAQTHPSIGSDNATTASDVNSSTGYYLPDGGQVPSEVAPHFRVPITDRFNYANLDCSARVHGSHRSAKSPASILSSKKDRYMLSPCNALKEKQFVVVELCDDIRIDTVQLANFEFFSGVFKDFTVSVAKTYTTDPDGWAFAGTYRAKNVRGVQSFHLPTSLRDFYRFIRIDFLSSYGNEYYCPVSLLRVYGLTHLEEWKWDIWQAESKTKGGRALIPPVEVIPTSSVQVSPAVPTTSQQSDDMEGSISATEDHAGTPVTILPPDHARTTSMSVLTTAIPSETTHHEPDNSRIHSTSIMSSQSFSAALPSEPSASLPVDAPPSADQTTPPYTTTPSTTIHISVSQDANRAESILNSSSESHTRNRHQHSDHSISSAHKASSPSPYSGPSLVHAHPALAPPPSGESIYRTIMNRLTAVENNQTLYMKYVEQQNGAMRDVIRRLGEDLGRLDGIIRAQSVAFQRTVNDWEKQRYQLQMEYGYVSKRVEVLSEEIILEKRLGVAQLCLLLAVLVFLGLTRGSRATEGITVRQHSSKGLREWGRRHLSWTGDYWGAKPKGAERRDQFDGQDKDANQNKSHNRIGRKTIYRPQPLDLGPFGNNILNVNVIPEELQLPFPSSEPPLQRLKPMTAITPPRRTISNPRSTGSGSATPLHSAPVPHSHGHNRRVIQRPATPTSRSQLLFKTPQALHRSQSFTRSIGNVETGRVPLRLPTPVSQSSSWAGPLTVAPKSAKRWARTAHLHEVKKGGQKQENVGVDRGLSVEENVAALKGKSKAHDLQAGGMDTDDDFFTSQPERHPLSMSTRLLNTQGAGTSSKANRDATSRRLFLDHEVGSSSSDPTYHLGLEKPSRLALMKSTMQDESDSWVDTDSASVVEDSGEEIFDIFPSIPPMTTLKANDTSTVGVDL